MNGAAQYQRITAQTAIVDASPHRLVQLMFDGALARLAAAGGAMRNGRTEQRSKALNSALAIIGGLQGCLDMERGGDLARNLDSLYDYMQRRLLTATVTNDPVAIDEVMGLLAEVKSGWDAIAADVESDHAALA